MRLSAIDWSVSRARSVEIWHRDRVTVRLDCIINERFTVSRRRARESLKRIGVVLGVVRWRCDGGG